MMSLNETLPRSPSCRFSASRASAARSMSTSVVRKKWGTGPREVAKRFAIVLRIWVSGTSSYGAPVRETGTGDGGGGTGATGAEADTVAAGRAAAVPRSRRTTRPPGPGEQLQVDGGLLGHAPGGG